MADVNVLAYDRSPVRTKVYAEAIREVVPDGVAATAWCPAGHNHPPLLHVIDTRIGRMVAIVERRRQELARLTRDEVRFEVLWITTPLDRLTGPVSSSCSSCGATGVVALDDLRSASNNRNRVVRLPVTPTV